MVEHHCAVFDTFCERTHSRFNFISSLDDVDIGIGSIRSRNFNCIYSSCSISPPDTFLSAAIPYDMHFVIHFYVSMYFNKCP